MSTSNSYDYSLSAANIIQSAFEDIGEVEPGGTVLTAHSTMALRHLNIIAKQLQGDVDGWPGLKIHTRKRIGLFLESGQQEYLIGPSANHSRSASWYGKTTLSAAEAAGQTTLSVTATTYSPGVIQDQFGAASETTIPLVINTMAASDYIGIELDSGEMQWTSINTTGAGTVTVNVALTGAASAGNAVYWFTSRAQRFPILEAAVLRDANDNDTELAVFRDGEYELLSSKTSSGEPTSIAFEPMQTATRIMLDSRPTDFSKHIRLTVLYPAQDYDATTDDIAFPQEAFGALKWELILALCPGIGKEWTPVMEKNYQRAVGMASRLNPKMSTDYFVVGGL